MPRKKSAQTQAERIIELLLKLYNSSGFTYEDIINEFDVDRRTAARDIELLASRLPLEAETIDDRKKLWRLMPSARRSTLNLNVGEIMSLFMALKIFNDFAGTDLELDLQSLIGKVEHNLEKADILLKQKLHKKIFVIEDAPRLYEKHSDDIDEIRTALLREQKIKFTYAAWGKKREHIVEPYTLLYYRHGLYLYGKSNLSGGALTFNIERMQSVEWLRGEGFEYPKDYEPREEFKTAFHIMTGKPERVEIAFTQHLEDYLKSRRWHETQKFTRMKDGRIKMTMKIAPSAELIPWILSFGPDAKAIKPKTLTAELKTRITKMKKLY